MAARLTQAVVEVVRDSAGRLCRLTQVVVEVLRTTAEGEEPPPPGDADKALSGLSGLSSSRTP